MATATLPGISQPAISIFARDIHVLANIQWWANMPDNVMVAMFKTFYYMLWEHAQSVKSQQHE